MNSASSSKGTLLFLGMTSPIARATAAAFARNGWNIVLGARDREENEIIANDLRVRYGIETTPIDFEAMNFENHPAFVREVIGRFEETLEGVFVGFGTMPPQEEAERNPAIARGVVDSNFSAAVSLLELFAAHFERRRRGWICAVSSVAGDRGRMSNYIYGAAKAGFSTYLAGLRNRLYHQGVHVTTVKPGPVDTGMTFGMKKLPFLAQPADVGNMIYLGIIKKKNVIYTPPIWRVVMGVIGCIPEWQFKKMKM